MKSNQLFSSYSKALILLCLAPLFFGGRATAQTVPEWLTVAKGIFTSSHCYDNLARSVDGQYFAAVSSDLAFDSANVVLISDDAGTTWRGVRYDHNYNFDPITFQPLPGDWRQRWYQSVARPTKNLILVYASDRSKSDMSSDPVYGALVPYILRSEDAGKTWERIEITTKTKVSFTNRLTMADEKTGFLTANTPPDITADATTLYRTTDAGKTWQPVTVSFSLNNIRALQALSASDLVIVTKEGLYTTRDGGATWTSGSAAPDVTSKYFFRTTQIGYATSGVQTGNGQQETTTAFRTIDGGNSWTVMLDTLLGGSMGDCISFADDNNGLVMARDYFLQTTDGGNSWNYIPPPYGVTYSPSHSVIMTSANRAVGTMSEHIVVMTGRTVIAPTIVSWNKLDTFRYAVTWKPMPNAKRYRLQVADDAVNEFGLLVYNFGIFDTPKKWLDTIITDTALTLLTPLKPTRDYFARVMALNDSIDGAWSQQSILRTPAGPAKPLLTAPNPVYPPHDTTLATINVTFRWQKDDRATRYSLLLTDRGNYPGAWDDSIAQNVYNITADSITLTLLPGRMYFWLVRSWAPGFDSTSSQYYHLFRTAGTLSIDDVSSIAPDISISPNPASEVVNIGFPVSGRSAVITDALGRTVWSATAVTAGETLSLDVHSLPAGAYVVRLDGRTRLITSTFIITR